VKSRRKRALKRAAALFSISLLALSLIFFVFPIFFSNKIPAAYGTGSTITQNSGDPSARSFVKNVEIENDVYFDGANYHFITQYGNYTWLQPGNIMEYYDLNGSEIIDKSMFILQENSSGTWLPLLDMTDEGVSVDVANSSHYICSYTLEDKYRGKWYNLADVTLTMDMVHRGALPKISISMIQDPTNWSLLDLGDFRWIWDVVPLIDPQTDEGFKYWIDHDSNSTQELPSDQLISLDVDFFCWLSSNSSYSAAQSGFSLRLDCSDETLPPAFYGGVDPYWNSRGIVAIFPVNQADVDPSTVYDSGIAYPTRNTWQNRVFKNPRGQEYYWALVQTGTTSSAWYYSSDGSTWYAEGETVSTYTTTGGSSTWIIEDASNSRLLVYCVSIFTSAGVDYIGVECDAIADSTAAMTELWKDNSVATETDDGLDNPSICIDDDDYLWISWVDEYTSSGKQRFDTYVAVSSTTKPTSAPSWSSAKIYDGSSDTYNSNPSSCQIVPLTATGDAALITNVHTYGVVASKTYRRLIYGYVCSRGSPPTAGSQINFGNGYGANDEQFKAVVEDAAASDVYVLYESYDSSNPGNCLYVRKWDVSAGTTESFGNVYEDVWDDHSAPVSYSMSFDATNDLLYAFYCNSTTGAVYYTTNDISNYEIVDVDADFTYRALDDSRSIVAQEITPGAITFNEAGWKMYNGGSPTGTAVAKVWDSTGSSTLYTSEPLPADEIGSYVADTVFHFQEDITLSAATTYIIGVEYTSGTSSNYISVAFDNSDVGSGFFTEYTTGWSDQTGWDTDITLWLGFTDPETEIDDSSINEGIDYVSSSYTDWADDGAIQVIWTTTTNYYARFEEVGVTAGEYSRSASLSLTFTFNGDLTYVEVSRAATLTLTFVFSVAAILEAIRSASLGLTMGFSTVADTSFGRVAALSLTLTFAAVVSYLEVSRAASLSLTFVFGTAILIEIVRSASLSLSTNFSTARELAAERVGSLALSVSSSAAAIFEPFKTASLSLSWSSNVATLIEAVRSASLSLAWSSSVAITKEILKAASLSLTTGFSTVADYTISRAASLGLSISSSTSRILEAARSGSLSITWSSTVAVLKEFLKSASLSISTGFSTVAQVGAEYVRSATLSITTSFNTASVKEIVRSASQSISVGFSTVGVKNVSYLAAASLGIAFIFHAWGVEGDVGGIRGEYIAAGLVVSFILIPMLLFIIYAVTRRR
jgi:hypothetical protein